MRTTQPNALEPTATAPSAFAKATADRSADARKLWRDR